MNNVMDCNIDELDISVRTWWRLKHAGIYTVGQLCELTSEEVMKIRLMTNDNLEEIKKILLEFGITLKDDGITSKTEN